MSEYVPTTEEVLTGWMLSGPPASTVVRALDFGRWLDQVKADARREGQAEAWDEGEADGRHNAIEHRPGMKFTNPYMGDS